MMVKLLIGVCIFAILSAGSASAQEAKAFYPGEQTIYRIRKLAMDVGEMTLTYEGTVAKNGRELLLLRLSVEAFKYTGEDKIYLDPQTFLPVTVERDIVVFGNKEQIVEQYDPFGSVVITKTVDDQITTQTITKDGPLENIYGFIFRYRKTGRLAENEDLNIRLPTQDVTMTYEGLRSIKAKGVKVDAYYLESSPKAYRIWLEVSSEKIPLRIDGTAGFGNTAMLLKEYKPGRM